MMRKRRHRLVGLLVVGLCLCLARPAPAYIDPGTQTAVVQMLAVILGGIGLCIGVLIWPFKRFLWWVKDRFGPRAARAVLVATAVVLVGGVVAGVAVLFAPEDTEEPPKVDYTGSKRVILLGMDGLDPNLMDKMMDAGELPNFDRLREEGSYSRLQTTLPPETPVAWSGIGTGCNPGKHGIFDFLHRDPASYKILLSIYKVNTSNLLDKREKRYLPVRHAPGFWTFATEAGIPATVIRWPAAFPPERITGHFLSGLGVPDVRGGLGKYSLFTTDDKDPGGAFKGNRCCAAWDGDTFKGSFPGPVVAGLTGRKESKVEVVVRKLRSDEVSLKIGGAPEVVLKVGEWSEYIPMRFKPGWGKTIPAMVCAHLTALEPHLRLYVSTAEVDPLDPYFPITYPDGFAKELAEAVGRYTTLGMPEDVNAMKDGSLSPEAFEQGMLKLFEERKKQFDHEFKAFDKGLFAFVFDSGDRIQHMFWRTRDKEHPNYDAKFAKKFGHVIPDVYRRMDAVLGEVLATAGDETTVIVVSDHGFNTFRASVGLNSWLVENGYMVLTTPDGRNGRELFADVDWSRTRAYSAGFASMYVNLKGREKHGIVEPGEEQRRLCDELIDKLRQLKDPVNAQPVIRNVYLASEVYHGEHARNGPDLVVGFRAGYRAEDSNVIGAAPAQIVADNMSLWTGDHLMDPHVVPGVFFANRKLRRGSPRNIDVAPTVLQCLSIQRPDSMDGEPLF